MPWSAVMAHTVFCGTAGQLLGQLVRVAELIPHAGWRDAERVPGGVQRPVDGGQAAVGFRSASAVSATSCRAAADQ